MRRHLMIVTALLASAISAHAGQLACLPANLPGGTGTMAVASVNAAGAWAGWYCGGIAEPQIVVISKASITGVHQVLLAAALSGDLSLSDINGLIQRMSSGEVTAEPLRSVWWPERDKLKSIPSR